MCSEKTLKQFLIFKKSSKMKRHCSIIRSINQVVEHGLARIVKMSISRIVIGLFSRTKPSHWLKMKKSGWVCFGDIISYLHHDHHDPYWRIISQDSNIILTSTNRHHRKSQGSKNLYVIHYSLCFQKFFFISDSLAT